MWLMNALHPDSLDSWHDGSGAAVITLLGRHLHLNLPFYVVETA